MDEYKKIVALYPGTFDPITNGHLSLIDRALQLCDELIVAVAESDHKATTFSLDERREMVEKSVAGLDIVRVVTFDNLLADFAADIGATVIIRGLRAVSDFEYEFQMALMNRKLVRNLETVFMMPALSWVYLSSTIVKDVARHHGDISGLVPEPVAEALKKRYER